MVRLPGFGHARVDVFGSGVGEPVVEYSDLRSVAVHFLTKSVFIASAPRLLLASVLRMCKFSCFGPGWTVFCATGLKVRVSLAACWHTFAKWPVLLQ